MLQSVWKLYLVFPAIAYAYVFGQDVTVRGCPGDIRAGTDVGKNVAGVEWTEPRFIGNEQQRVIPVRSHAPGDIFFIGETTIRYTAYVMGTKATCVFKVTVEDNEPPQIDGCPRTVEVSADPGKSYASGVIWEPPSASDNIRLVEFRSSPPMGSRFLLGVTSVNYWALDPNGNKGNCSFMVIVDDKESPTFRHCPHNIIMNVEPTDIHRSVNWVEPKARDNAEIARVVSTHQSGDMFPLGTTVVRYTVEDYSGNTGTCSFFVTARVTVPDKHIFIRNYTTSTIEITWPETVDITASGYLIYAWPFGGEDPPATEHLYQAVNKQEGFASRNIRSLLPGNEYNIKIVIAGVNKVLRTTQRTKPMPPASVSTKPGTLTPVSFTVLWKPRHGSVSSYSISVSRTPDRHVVLQTSVGSESNHLHVSGLEPDTEYEVSVHSVSGYSDDETRSGNFTIYVKTGRMVKSGVLIREVTSDAITITGKINPFGQEDTKDEDDVRGDNDVELRRHSKRNSDINILYIYSDASDLFTDVIFESSVWSYTFSRLKPVTNYTIRTVNNQNGIAFETNATTKPSPVTDLHISAITRSTATVQWVHALGPRDHYEITLRPSPKYMTGKLPIKTRDNVIEFTSLTGGDTYTVNIVTVKRKLRSKGRRLMITPGVDHPVALHLMSEKPCLSPLIACGFLGAGLLLCFLSFLTAFIFSKGLPAKLRKRRSPENEYDNPSHHQYSSYLNSLNTRIAQMRRSESNTYNFPPIARRSRTLTRHFVRPRPNNTLQRTQSESVIYYNLSD